MVSVDEPDPGAAIVGVLKAAVAPDGNPLAERETGELKPLTAKDDIKDVEDAPAETPSDVGDADRVKSGTAVAAVTISAKSSNTNEVFRLPFSTPTK